MRCEVVIVIEQVAEGPPSVFAAGKPVEIRVRCVGIATEAVLAVRAMVASIAPTMGMGMASVDGEVKAVAKRARDGVVSMNMVGRPARSVA